MSSTVKYPRPLVFGLDIGTRSIVGTVGYRDKDNFYIVAQEAREHETRAMLDGQIHDIAKVGATIAEVKAALELKIGMKLTEVCIAAAGRVLRTRNAFVEMEFDADTIITTEHIYELDSAGVEKAYNEFQQSSENDEKYYCVGHTVVHYYLNGNVISNLENHKARKIGMELIATFLPDDVVDGLYRAVEMAGLSVANLTLEPIAAIEAAIPEKYRMLNIALIDVGAGTSDICITRDGSIVSYGMIPTAGDGLTEEIAKHCLVDFGVAEEIKRGISESDVVKFEDIMGLSQTITKEEILNLLQPQIDDMTKKVSDCIKECNGGKPVSAAFVVGGGGKIEGYTNKLANELGIQVQRVALRGEEVMQKIVFLDQTLKKDSLLITPIGICLNFYEQNNNFIFVSFNDERIKLYDNGKLAVVDAVMQAGFSNEDLFPKRGKELNFFVNGKSRIVRGNPGETAEILRNGENADLHTFIHANDIIRVIASTAGSAASIAISSLPEFSESIYIMVNKKRMRFPKFASVNKEMKSGEYRIQDNDRIELLPYYTVEQVLEFLDIDKEKAKSVYVNNVLAERKTKVYENFSFEWSESVFQEKVKMTKPKKQKEEVPPQKQKKVQIEENISKEENEILTKKDESEETLCVMVNNKPTFLRGKKNYIFVDIFDRIDFDLTQSNGRAIVTNLNGKQAQYLEPLKDGDVIDLFWKE